ncbi:hypothetical protein JCGZ_22044 [Jatropha curcas]|uniref:Uncharacterized protein n=1 Tax=Jatropha curcas TaxID=180498 RepID=A0A067LJ02_JATCU|nr:hypothetical protein JCGZ_22044 [Jatropha curcas]
MAYLLRMDSITFYPGSRLMRQMEHVQGLQPAGPLFRDILISPRVTVAILGGWSRGDHVVEAEASGGKNIAYEDWWATEHGDREREHKATLTREVDARLRATIEMILDSTRQAVPVDSDDSRNIHPRWHIWLA